MSALLDVKDVKLLYHLSKDARQSDTQLAKAVGLSKNAIKYRITRLQKENIIMRFACAINLGVIKHDTYTIIFRFNDDLEAHPEILEHFKNHPFANMVATLSGQYDLIAEFIAKDLYHFEDSILSLVAHFGQALNSYQAYFSHLPLRVEHLPPALYNEIAPEEPQLPRKEPLHITLDDLDRKILFALNQDATRSYISLAQATGTTLAIVRYRIKHYQQKGLLIKCFPTLNLKKLGYTQYLYILKLKNVFQEKMAAIRSKIRNSQDITYAFFDIAGFNLIFTCAFKNAENIDRLARSLRKDYGDIIDSQEYSIIKEHVLFNLFPRGLLEPETLL